MLATVPNTSIRLFSTPRKMPCPSWSLPAHRSCPRAAGSICDSCYAAKGSYVWPVVKQAQEARFQWTLELMRQPEGPREWIEHMVAAIRKSRVEYFRVHDSGDMFNVRYALSWLEVCKQLPEVRFWIPTRAWQQPKSVLPVYDPVMMALRKLAELPNVTVRPSALNFGDSAPVVEGLHAGTTADGPGRQCPAPQQGGECGECRVCWTHKKTAVTYKKH